MLHQGAALEQGDLGHLGPDVDADLVAPDGLAPALAAAPAPLALGAPVAAAAGRVDRRAPAPRPRPAWAWRAGGPRPRPRNGSRRRSAGGCVRRPSGSGPARPGPGPPRQEPGGCRRWTVGCRRSSGARPVRPVRRAGAAGAGGHGRAPSPCRRWPRSPAVGAGTWRRRVGPAGGRRRPPSAPPAARAHRPRPPAPVRLGRGRRGTHGAGGWPIARRPGRCRRCRACAGRPPPSPVRRTARWRRSCPLVAPGRPRRRQRRAAAPARTGRRPGSGRRWVSATRGALGGPGRLPGRCF